MTPQPPRCGRDRPPARADWLELGAGAARDHRAGLQHVAAARGLEGIAGVLLDQQHAGAGRVDGLDRPEDVLHDDRRQPERGLVQAEQLRLRHHGAAERQHLLLAPAQRAGVLAAALRSRGNMSKTPSIALAHFGGVVADA